MKKVFDALLPYSATEVMHGRVITAGTLGRQGGTLKEFEKGLSSNHRRLLPEVRSEMLPRSSSLKWNSVRGSQDLRRKGAGPLRASVLGDSRWLKKSALRETG